MVSKFIFNDLTAIIADYKFYAENEQDIDSWLWKHDCERQGMVVKFCNKNTKLMFIMRWA